MTGILGICESTYLAVFLAEIAGDKLIYTSGVLATRCRSAAVLTGMTLAFMAKMGVAVALGAAVGTLLPVWLVALLTALSFAGVAVTMARSRDAQDGGKRENGIAKGALVAFATIFFSEFGDKGMISAGTMAATWFSAAPSTDLSVATIGVVVWLGSVAAMVTKGALAVVFGASLRRWIAGHVPARHLRYGAVTTMVVLGVLSIFEVVGILKD